MHKPLELAILNTLSYSTIFSYPLTNEEIWEYLIWEEKEKPPTKNEFIDILSKIKIPNYKNYYYFSNQKIVETRFSKEKYSVPKLALAQKTVELLQKIPTIKLIGISGALSMNNADKNDDIDLFIICQKNTLWLTRFLATFLLDLKNLRRKPHDKKFKDKICLNMFLEENYLTLPKDKQNLYTAHEVIQLKPVYVKNHTYQKFLSANSWISNYLPNAIHQNVGAGSSRPQPSNHLTPPGRRPSGPEAMQPFSHLFSIIHDSLFMILNYTFMIPQLLYMRPRRTTETINSHVLFFHPHDISKKVLKNYYARLALIS